MLSIFYVDLGNPKNVIKSKDISPQLDKILPREAITKYFWKDEYNQNSIFLRVLDDDREEVLEICIRFDLEVNYSNFMNQIIDFLKKNDFELSIHQRMMFSVNKISEELIAKNVNNMKFIEDPLAFLESQKKHFRQLVLPNSVSKEKTPDYWIAFDKIVSIQESTNNESLVRKLLEVKRFLDGSVIGWQNFKSEFETILQSNLYVFNEEQIEDALYIIFCIEDGLKNM